jgi:hypothetical protein
MKLNEKYSIEKDGAGFALVEKTVINTKVDGKFTGETRDGKNKRFYGTVYQALQGFLSITVNSSESLDGIRDNVLLTIDLIDMAKDKIKREFCIEVRKEK